MKQLIYLLFFICCGLRAQTADQWNSYFSYTELVAMAKGKDVVFGATSSALIRYNIHSNEIEVYNSISGLKATQITSLYFSELHQKVVIGNVDGTLLVYDLKQDRIRTLSDIKDKPSLQSFEKRINAFFENKSQLYIATNYGISVLNLNNDTFGDTYYVGANGQNCVVHDIVSDETNVLALTSEGIKQIAWLNPNKIDFRQWQLWLEGENWMKGLSQNNRIYLTKKDDNTLYLLQGKEDVIEVVSTPSAIVNLNKDDQQNLLVITANQVQTLKSGNQLLSTIHQNALLDAVQIKDNYYFISGKYGLFEQDKNGQQEILSPSGPESNRVFSLLSTKEGVWFISGGYDKTTYNPYTPFLASYGLSYFNKKKGWEYLSHQHLKQANALTYATLNPKNSNELFVGSYHSGLLKIALNKSNIAQSEVMLYNHENTGNGGLENLEMEPGSILPEGYVTIRVNGVVFDKQSKLWMTNNFVRTALKSRDESNQWQSYLSTNEMFDYKRGNYGRLVVDKNNTKWIPSLEDGLTAFNDTRNNRLGTFSADMDNLPSNNVSALAIDKTNTLWIGTNKGLRVIPNVDRFLQSNSIMPTNIVIEENGIAEELFYQQYITVITVDGANRKWVALADAGVFLVSPTGKEVIRHFTNDNSPLPSNTINDIVIDDMTGEVFFATDLGVVSVISDTTEGQDTNRGFYAYPNPVRPEFADEVRIVGLMDRSVVKIVDIEGNLMYETTSNGGMVIWDTFAMNGKKVSTGVYLIMVSSVDNSNTQVKKLMIIR